MATERQRELARDRNRRYRARKRVQEQAAKVAELAERPPPDLEELKRIAGQLARRGDLAAVRWLAEQLEHEATADEDELASVIELARRKARRR